MNISHGDLKCENLLIKEGILRIIDFGISLEIGFNGTNIINPLKKIEGYSRGYLSPELKDIVDKKKPNKANPFKCDVYSCGILGLIFSSGIKSSTDLNNLDYYKNNEKIHDEYITKLLEQCQWHYEKSNSEEITPKINLILKNILSFNPEERICFIELYKILKNINSMELNEIEKLLNDKNELNNSPLGLKVDDNNLFSLYETVIEEKIHLKQKMLEIENENEKLKYQKVCLEEINKNLTVQINSIQKRKTEQEIAKNILNELSELGNIYKQSNKRNKEETKEKDIEKNLEIKYFYITKMQQFMGNYQEIINILDVENHCDVNKGYTESKRVSKCLNYLYKIIKLLENSNLKNPQEYFNQDSFHTRDHDEEKKDTTKILSQQFENNQECTYSQLNLNYQPNQITPNEIKIKQFQEKISKLSEEILLTKLSSMIVKSVIQNKTNNGHWNFGKTSYNLYDVIIILKLAEEMKAKTIIFC